MSKQLTDLVIDEVSLVDDGMNPGASVEIFKARSGKPKADPHAEPDADEMGGESDADEDDPESATSPKGKKKPGAMPDQFNKRLEGQMTTDLEAMAQALEAADARMSAVEAESNVVKARNAELETVLKARDARISELETAAAGAGESADAVFLKGLPESAREAIMKSRKRAEDAEIALSKMRDAQDQAEAIAKAKTYGVGKADEIGPILVRVAKGMTTVADAEKLAEVLKAAGRAVSTSQGFSRAGAAVAIEGDPETIMKGKIAEYQAKNPGASVEAATDAVLSANPALYDAQVAKSRRGGAAGVTA